jgi:hypothetical protein
MVKNVLKEYFPRTAAYIQSLFEAGDVERVKHHNYLSKQHMLNTTVPVADQTTSQLKRSDTALLRRLKALDSPEVV